MANQTTLTRGTWRLGMFTQNILTIEDMSNFENKINNMFP
jgi:hypothetical protein